MSEKKPLCVWLPCSLCEQKHHTFVYENDVGFTYCSEKDKVVLCMKNERRMFNLTLFSEEFIRFLKRIQTQTAYEITNLEYFMLYGHMP